MLSIEHNTEEIENAVSVVTNSFNWELTIAIIALVIAVLAILVAVFLYLKLNFFIKDERIIDEYANMYGKKPSSMKDLIVAAVVTSSRLDRHIMGKYRQSIAQSQKYQNSNNEISTSMYNEIVENVVRQVEKRMSNNTLTPRSYYKKDPTAANTMQVLYATSYNADNGTFYEVTRQPSEQTVFEIAVNPDKPYEGCLEVYRNAYPMVAECKDFLEYCCEIVGSGTNLQTIERGKVELNGGIWIVKNKLKVRFN